MQPLLEEETKEKSRAQLSTAEQQKVRTVERFRSPVIYEIIRRQGEEELHRPSLSLLIAGIAAGLAMGFSVLTEALLAARLPHSDWSPLIVSLGYSVGFLIVIMSRLQLFTENTITAVMPICAYPTARNFLAVVRLWSFVLLGNLVGTFIFAFYVRHSGALTAADFSAFRTLSEHVLAATFGHTLVAGVFSGFLIACLVWVAPSIRGAEFWMILLVTYIMALGQFAHVIVGSAEAWFVVIDGSGTLTAVASGYVLPALIGNIIGGTGLFTLLAYTQVSTELEETGQSDDDKEAEKPQRRGGRRDV